jgi:hypothetical protein
LPKEKNLGIKKRPKWYSPLYSVDIFVGGGRGMERRGEGKEGSSQF